MKVLFLCHYYPPEGNAPATRVGALARRWVEAGHEVTVITCAPNVPDGVVYPGYANRLLPQTSVVDGVKVVRVWSLLAPNKGTGRRIANYVSYMVTATLKVLTMGRPDVLIATSPQFFCGWAGVLSKWWFRLSRPWTRKPKFILEIRDIWPESIGAVGALGNPLVMKLLEWMELRMYAAANHVVTVGNGYKLRLLERGVPEEKMSIVMNGVDRDLLEASTPDPAPVRKEWGLKDKFVCAYIGTIGMASGLDVYLRAAKRLKEMGEDDVVLLAVGDGAVREDLQQAAAEQGLDNVVFTGRRPKEEMPQLLAATDVCFVHLRKTPLFETVMPSKIFEALGMRRPILIGVDGEARNLVEASGGGVSMEPEDEVQMVERILELKRDPERRAAMGEAGREYVLKNFDRDQLARDYLEVLKS
ncbi:glycosyltransferase family 4 protein [Sulfuriroseicoccus oceanibius]|uniref:Glycosyltransferase family 4 protein n=1 Tax=Sulfuriroseicoccus oceanibius TaxID=2707525 RepID=A0A6B3L5A4_9BACT|nr:glycosyltransferase family 4 protein [Sulfuriroseicoccus oceanibius]QQL44305.1 glycosyltransferase family 4 protein [Sulfuriroseicoccus oceanibius]